MSLVEVYARVVLGGIFLLSGVAKLFNFTDFVAAFEGYRVLPSRFTRPAACGITAIEIVLGIALLTRTGATWPHLVSLTLLGVFTVAIIRVLVNGQRDAKCGCSVPGFSGVIGWHTAIRNMALALLACVGLWPDAALGLGVLSVMLLFAGIMMSSREAQQAVQVAHFDEKGNPTSDGF